MMSRYQRSFLWIKELTISLFHYWLKNPFNIYRIIIFTVKKIKYIPLFLQRNTQTEYYEGEFEKLLAKTVELYNQTKFDPQKESGLQNLKKNFENPYQILYFLVRKFKPKIVVETGVAAGYTTGFILQGIKDNGSGKLYSIDLPFQWYSYGKFELHLDSLPAGKFPGYLIPPKLKKNWKLIIGDTKTELPKLLKKLGQIDIFFHDSEHTYNTMMFEYNQAWPKLTAKGILVSDDIKFSQAFDQFVKEKKKKGYIFLQLGIIFR